MTLVEFTECNVPELGHGIAQLHALQSSVNAYLLRFIAEYDRRKAWREDGCTTMTDWLVARLNIARRTAKDLVAIARRLDDEPELSEPLAGGELSLDQVRAASLLPDLDPREGAGKTAAQLEAEVRASREVDGTEDAERRRQKSVRWWWDEDAGMLHLRGRLPDVQGQRLVTALERQPSPAGSGHRDLRTIRGPLRRRLVRPGRRTPGRRPRCRPGHGCRAHGRQDLDRRARVGD